MVCIDIFLLCQCDIFIRKQCSFAYIKRNTRQQFFNCILSFTEIIECSTNCHDTIFNRQIFNIHFCFHHSIQHCFFIFIRKLEQTYSSISERYSTCICHLCTMALVKACLDFCIGTVCVICQTVNNNCGVAWTESFISCFIIGFIRTTLCLVNGSFDNISRNLVLLCLGDLSSQAEVHIRIRDAALCCNIQLFSKSGIQLGLLCRCLCHGGSADFMCSSHLT